MKIRDLLTGLTYYLTAIFATIYVIIRPLPRTFLDWVYKRQAKRRNWHGLSSLPPYVHKRQSHRPSQQYNAHEKQPPTTDATPHHPTTTHTPAKGRQHLSGDMLIAEHKFWSLSDCPVVQRTYITPDKLSVNYYIIYPGNPHTMMIANGLGVSRSFVGFAPLIHRYGKVGGDWSFITWDYRGLFESGPVKHTRKLAVHYHAEDCYNIIKQEGIKRIDCLVGFSMGVQVVLEFALIYPESVHKLLLVNGAYGNVLQTLYQPFGRVPFMDRLLYFGTELIVHNTWLFRVGFKPARAWILLVGYVYSFFLGSPFLRELLGSDYLVKFFDEYVGGVVSSHRHSENYMRLVLEMNAHSVYHHLREIEQPTLIISGLLDPLTPCYLSFEMAKLLPHSMHCNVKYSSHFTLLEQPRQALRAIIEHLEGIKFKKLNDKSFVIDYENSNIQTTSDMHYPGDDDIDVNNGAELEMDKATHYDHDDFMKSRKVIVPK